MNYIYCITNLINEKRYVGKTTQSIEERFKEHCRDSIKEHEKSRPLYDAMNKYGVENFKVELLEEVKDEQDLSNREIYWITELHSYGKDGYNATKGGDGILLYNYDDIVSLYNLGYTITEVAEKMNCDNATVTRILKSRGVYQQKDRLGKRINQFDKAHNFIQTFVSSKAAARWLVEMGKSKSEHSASNHIINCCKHKLKSIGGYIWEYAIE